MQPLDRVASTAIIVLGLIITVMLLLGARALPQVRTFSWQDRIVTADDVAFLMTFTQPVDHKSVEDSLKIDPALGGKFSWGGRRMAYTLDLPVPYGESYRVTLPAAKTLNAQRGFEPFASTFRTRDRAFAYIGAEGEEQGRLILFNLTRKEKTLLTPADQRILDFKPYPERDRILFSAVSTQAEAGGLALAQLYTVSTGLAAPDPASSWQFWQRQPKPAAAGTIQLILDNKDYQNLKFDLSPNGQLIVVQRVNQQKPADFGPWVLTDDSPPRKLKTEPGGDFRIAPDSLSLLLQQGEGTAVISLQENITAAQADELLDFLPEYGLTLDIASDGSAAALVNFNQDDPDKQFTQSLFWLSNQGEEKLLLQTDGAVLDAQFDENNEILYCLVNRLVAEGEVIPGEDEDERQYQVAPYLTAINIETGQAQKLLEMPPQPEITVSLSPDGLAILFDEALVIEPSVTDTDFSGATARLWLLPLFSTVEERLSAQPAALVPAELELTGRQPIWLP
ncbi:MAG: hypothetical protein WBB01_15055 [Phormidesmis sp.]